MKWLIAGLVVACVCSVRAGETAQAIRIGSRLELLVDKFLVDAMKGAARLQLHHPVRRDIVLRTDEPWGGNASGYQSIFKDGALYKMYYRGGHYRHSGPPAQALDDHPWVLCYAESDDGIHWRKPKLGLCEYNGSKANNIILTTEMVAAIGGCPAHTATFKDANPDCPPDARYKIVIVGSKPRGLFILKSADGLRFTLASDKPFQTEGAFDSQNLAFWDPIRKEYREYHRHFRAGVRGIMTATSKDILHFPKPKWLVYPGAPVQALYTNQIQPYTRAPHIFMGFPMRYNDRGWSGPMFDLPGLDERLARAKSHPRYGTTVTDAAFMTSRDGLHFKRWAEGFIRPGPKKKDTWVYGDNFVFWGMAQTKSHIDGAPDELSLYAVEGYWEGVSISVRRYTIRVDGFVSAYAPFKGGEVVTKPIIFDGGNLALNAATSAAGSIQVEIQDAEGTPIEGYTLDDCPPIFCDDLRYIVRWDEPGGDVRPLAGKPVRLRFVLKDADLYAFQFVPHAQEPKRPLGHKNVSLPAKKNKNRKPFVALKDDFQAVKAGTSPTTDDLNPKAGESGWFIAQGSPDRVQVLNDDPPASGKPGANHYLKAERRNEGSRQGGQAWLKLSPQDAADTKNGIVEVRARIFMPSTNKYCVDIDAYDNPPCEHQRRAFQVRFYPDGVVSYYRQQKNPIKGMKIMTDAWQSVAIRADLKAATFDLDVEGQKAQGLPFALDRIHRIQSIAFCPNTSNCTLFLDDVEVTVSP